MIKPEKLKAYWMHKKVGSKDSLLGLFRDGEAGCFILGGPTGSHYTGHGESWESKWKQLLKDGYIEVATAIAEGKLPKDWQPPKISRRDQELIDVIRRK
jgi:hypothetical protein